MSRFEAWFLHLATALVGITGLVYAWMLYLLEPVDPFAVAHHPLQPFTQHAHVVAAPFLIFALGLVWRRHVWAGWRSRNPDRRRSGLALALTFGPMTLSGYLLQTAVDETWKKIWVVVHVATSLFWLAGYLGHQVLRWRIGRALSRR